MFHDVPSPGDRDPAALAAAYAAELQSVIDGHGGVEAVAAAAEVPPDVVRAAAAGSMDEVTLEQGAALLALAGDRDATGIAEAARDALLIGMANAVMDVETLGQAVADDLEPREIQQKIEGRYPITLAEYARLFHAIHQRTP